MAALLELTEASENMNDVETGSQLYSGDHNLNESSHQAKPCIYGVPEQLRKVKQDAYTPQILLIGPLHRDKRKLERYSKMEKTKKTYFDYFVEKRLLIKEYTLNDLKTSIQEQETEIRQSYAPTAPIGTEEFVEMILHDSIFILELFLRNLEHSRELSLFLRYWERPKDSEEVNKPYKSVKVYTDLVLLENQLPFFLLASLFDPILGKLSPFSFPTSITTFRGLALAYFGSKHPASTKHTPPLKQISNFFQHGRTGLHMIRRNTTFKHFTDLHRYFRIERLDVRSFQQKDNMPIITNLPSATTLHSAGVKFKPHEKARSMIEIKFKKGCLRLPTLVVDKTSEIILRNIMALEQCHYPRNTYVCNYARFIDFLVEKEKDVELLIRKGIIENRTGQKDIAEKMLNSLCNDDVLEEWSLYHDIAEQLNKHYGNPLKRSFGTLRRVYFSNVWMSTASVAAALLLILTLVQTAASVIQVIQGFNEKK